MILEDCRSYLGFNRDPVWRSSADICLFPRLRSLIVTRHRGRNQEIHIGNTLCESVPEVYIWGYKHFTVAYANWHLNFQCFSSKRSPFYGEQLLPNPPGRFLSRSWGLSIMDVIDTAQWDLENQFLVIQTATPQKNLTYATGQEQKQDLALGMCEWHAVSIGQRADHCQHRDKCAGRVIQSWIEGVPAFYCVA